MKTANFTNLNLLNNIQENNSQNELYDAYN